MAVTAKAADGTITADLALPDGTYVLTGASDGSSCASPTVSAGSVTFSSVTAAAPDTIGAYLTASQNAEITWVCQAGSSSQTSWLDAIPVYNAAQLHLTSALDDANSMYGFALTYDPAATTEASNSDSAGQSQSSTTLDSEDSTLGWRDGSTSCEGTGAATCVSVEAVDSRVANDGQGVILASLSSDGACWFVAAIRTTPAAVTATGFDQSMTAGATGSQMTGPASSPRVITTTGTFYGYLPNAGTNCRASYPLAHLGGFYWGASYGAASDASVTASNT